MKIAIVTGIWKRHNIFEMCANGIRLLQEQNKYELSVIVSGSEGEQSKQLVEKHGFEYIEIPNEPLAEKMNAPVMRAKELNCDYVFCIGSDDIISPELFSIYLEHAKNGIDFVGVTDFYFYDTISGQSIYWGGYREDWRKGHTCGAGRLISKRLLDLWNWKLWETKHNRILDNSIQDKLKATPHTEKIFSIKEKNVFALDIKSEENMTPFNLWDNAEFIDTEIIKKQFSYLW